MHCSAFLVQCVFVLGDYMCFVNFYLFNVDFEMLLLPLFYIVCCLIFWQNKTRRNVNEVK